MNAIIRGIDPFLARWMWVSALWRGVASLGTLALFGIVLQQAVDGYFKEGKVTLALVIGASIALALYSFAVSVLGDLRDWRRSLLEEKLDFFLEERAIGKLQSLDLGRLSDPAFVALKERAKARGERSVLKVWDLQAGLIGSVFGLVASIGVAAALDPILMLCAVVPVVPRTVRAAVIERKRRERFEQEHLLRRYKGEYGSCLTNRRGAVQAKLFRFVPFILGRYSHFMERLRASSFELKRFDFMSEVILGALSAVIGAGVLMYLGARMIEGEASIAKLFFFLGSMKTLGTSLFGVSRAVISLGAARKDYAYLEEFYATKPLIDETGARAVSFASAPAMALDRATFSYPGQAKPALDGCSLAIEPGEKVAIVGRNGSGKTTVMRLLAKMYLPQAGAATIGGLPTGSILQESWIDHVLCVTQDSLSIDLPIDEAVTGSPREGVDWPRLRRAAELSGCLGFVEALPDGFSTQIGEDWPGGVGFSSGQLQRLKLMAAFYRLFGEKVHVGLFDEPMSNCDMETRRVFYESLRSFEGKTVVVIAHDPLFLQCFDRVVVIDGGKVVDDLVGERIAEYRDRLAISLSCDL